MADPRQSLPPGFEIDPVQALPPGFEIDQPARLPPGFEPDDDEAKAVAAVQSLPEGFQPDVDSWGEVGRKVLKQAIPIMEQGVAGAAQQAIERPLSSMLPLDPGAAIANQSGMMTPLQAGATMVDRVIRGGANFLREKLGLPEDDSAKQAADIYASTQADIAENAPNVEEGSLKDYAAMGAQSFIQMVPGLVAGFATRNPTVGVTVMGTPIAGQRYAQSRAEGRSPQEASNDATVTMLAEAVPEMLPLGFLMKPGGKFLTRTLKTMGLGGASEMLTQAIEDGYAKGTLNEDMTWGDVWNNIKKAGILGAVTEGTAAVVTHPFTPAETEAAPPPAGADAAAASGPATTTGGSPSSPAAAATMPQGPLAPAAAAQLSQTATPIPDVGTRVGLRQTKGPPEPVLIEGVQDGYVFFRREDGSQDAAKEGDFRRDLTAAPPPSRPNQPDATTVPTPQREGEPAPPDVGDINDFDPNAVRQPAKKPAPAPSPQGAMALPETRKIQALREAASANMQLAAQAERIGQKTPQEIAAYRVEAAKLMDQAAALERQLTPSRTAPDVTAATPAQLATQPLGPLGRVAPAVNEATTGPRAYPVTPAKAPQGPVQPQLAPVARSEAEVPQEPQLQPKAPPVPWQQRLRQLIGTKKASLNDPVAMARNLGTTPEAVTAELQSIATGKNSPIEIMRGKVTIDPKTKQPVQSKRAGKWRYVPTPTGKVTEDLADFVVRMGGIRPTGSFAGDLAASDLDKISIPFKGKIVNPKGSLTFEQMADAAMQEGFMVPTAAGGFYNPSQREQGGAGSTSANLDKFMQMLGENANRTRRHYRIGEEPQAGPEGAPRRVTPTERKREATRRLTALGFEPKGTTVDDLEAQLDQVLDAIGSATPIDTMDFARARDVETVNRMDEDAQDALRQEAGSDYPYDYDDAWIAAELAEGVRPAQPETDAGVPEGAAESQAEPGGEAAAAGRAKNAPEGAPEGGPQTSRITDEGTDTDIVVDLTDSLDQHMADGGTARSWVIEEGRRTGNEHVAVSVNGETTYGGTSNLPDVVAWYPPIAVVESGANVSFIHNHPKVAALSGADLGLLGYPGFTFTVAVTHDGDISAAAASEATDHWFAGLTQDQASEASMRLHAQAMNLAMRIVPNQLLAQDLAMRILNRAGLVEYYTSFEIEGDYAEYIQRAGRLIQERMTQNGFKAPDATNGFQPNRPTVYSGPGRIMDQISQRSSEVAARRAGKIASRVVPKSDSGEAGGEATARVTDRGRREATSVQTEVTDQGEQFVLPGAERSDKQALAARAAQQRIKPKKAQKEPGGLFEQPEAETGGVLARLMADESGAVPLPDWQKIKAYFGIGRKTPQTAQQIAQSAPKLGVPNRLSSFGIAARWLRSAMSLSAVDQPSAVYTNALLNQENTKNTLHRNAIQRMRPYSRLNRQAKARINKILEYARLYGVEIRNTGRDIVVRIPSGKPPFGEGKPELSRAGEIIALDANETAAFHELRKMFDETLLNLGAAMASERGYTGIFDKKSIQAAINNAASTRERRRAEAAMDAFEAMEELRRTGYVPFQRYGNAWINVKPRNPASGLPERTRFELLDTSSVLDSIFSRKGGTSRKRLTERIDELRKQYPDADYEITHGEVTPDSIANLNIPALEKALLALDANGITGRQKLVDDLMHEIFEARKGGFRKRAQNVPGYSLDFERAVMEYARQSSSVIARMAHRADVDSAYDGTQSHPVKAVRDFWKQHKEAQESSDDDFGLLRKIGFFMFLWGTPASAAMNLSQTPLVTMSQLATWAGIRAAGLSHGAMLEALHKVRVGQEGEKLLSKAGIKNVAKYSHGLTVDISEVGRTQAEKEMLAVLDSEGILSPNIMEDFGAGTLSKNSSERFRPALRRLDRAYDVGASMFNTTEVVNRVAAALAAYRAALTPGAMDKLRNVYKNDENFKQAVPPGATPTDVARWFVNETQFVGGKINRPKIGRGIGALLLQFKNFVMNYLRIMHKNFTRMGPQGKLAGTFMLMSMFLIGGLAGLPFGDDAIQAYDTIVGGVTKIDPDIEYRFREWASEAGFGDYGAEVLSRGFGRDVFGLDLTRLGMGNLFPDGNLTSLMPLVTGTVGRAAEVNDRWHTGQPVGALAAALGMVGGKGTQDIVKGFGAYPTEGISTRGGNFTVMPKDVTLADMTMRALGFQPTKATRASEAEYHAGRIANATKDARTAMLTKIARLVVMGMDAREAGDTEGAEEYSRQLQELYQSNAASLIDPDIPDWQKIPPAKRAAVKARVMSLIKPEIANIRRAAKMTRPTLTDTPFVQP